MFSGFYVKVTNGDVTCSFCSCTGEEHQNSTAKQSDLFWLHLSPKYGTHSCVGQTALRQMYNERRLVQSLLLRWSPSVLQALQTAAKVVKCGQSQETSSNAINELSQTKRAVGAKRGKTSNRCQACKNVQPVPSAGNLAAGVNCGKTRNWCQASAGNTNKPSRHGLGFASDWSRIEIVWRIFHVLVEKQTPLS